MIEQLVTYVAQYRGMSRGRRIVVCLLICFCGGMLQMTTGYDAQHFVNEWSALIPGGVRVAREVAEEHGFRVIRASAILPDHYALTRTDTPHRSRRAATHHTRSLAGDHRVMFAEQQQLLTRDKRELWDENMAGKRELRDENMAGKRELWDENLAGKKELWDENMAGKRELWDENLAGKRAAKKGLVDDPEFSHEWYINQAVNTKRGVLPVTDLRVKDVWRMGISGKNVVISVLDDGIESNNTDLIHNYDPQASYDLNDHDNDPFPRYDPTNENKHGTRCAGVASMSINNDVCGAGIAFDSKIGGIRMLDGKVNDMLEGEAISFGNQHIDIYSASWGPRDDGKVIDGPRTISSLALARGVAQGRGGKGNLYVWASGNGGYKGDCCSADGYASAIETISVSSSTEGGTVPRYAELCPSTLTTSYSSGSYQEGKVVSTDLHNQCTTSHTGTSASAPMVAGILALLLELNPNITWRDAQHIISHTSRMEPLAQVKGWYNNGAGYCVNLAFGFGLVDALAVVQLGHPAVWKGVGPQKTCEVEPIMPNDFPYQFQTGQSVTIQFNTDACAGTQDEINFLEHVKVQLSVQHEQRGRIYAELRSAMGTLTPLLLERSRDTSTKALRLWPLVSTHNWGERPHGIWTLRVADRNVKPFTKTYHGNVTGVKLILYGTKLQPEHQKLYPRNCKVADNLGQIKMRK